MATVTNKLREALENIKREAETSWDYRDYPIAGAPGERGTCPVVDADWLIDECKAALSEPARNCDRFKTKEEAEIEFMMSDELPRNNGDIEMRAWMCRFTDWLFAPAAERKGDGDGSK